MHQNTPITLLILAVGFTHMAKAQTFPPLKVPADPYAQYEVLDLFQRQNGMLEITTKRVGKSGESYAIRLVDCKRSLAKYIADSSTLEGLKRLNSSGKMSVLVSGSSTHAAAQYACSYRQLARQ